MRLFLVGLFLILLALNAAAQGMPGRGGHGGMGGREMGGPARDREHRNDPTTASRMIEPYGALERELPSLKVDLMVREDQIDAWRAVERDVRDIAEMERARRRHLQALKANDQSTALTFVSAVTEDDRVKAEAAADFRRHFEALYAALDDNQRAMLNRRVIQSQEDSLGSERSRPKL